MTSIDIAPPATRPPGSGMARRSFLASLGLTGATAMLAGPLLSSASRANAAAPSEAASSPSAARPLMQVGLYSGGWDYLVNRDLIKSMGLPVLRTGSSGVYGAAWDAMQADGVDVHVTISGTDRSKFADEQSWIADYLRVVNDFLTKYPARWIEVWNEPNFGMWSGATATQKQGAYGRLLVATYKFVKATWPSVGVIGFAAGAVSAAATGFVRGVFAAVPEARTAFDVCSLHPYIGNTAPDADRKETWGTWSIAGQVKGLRDMGITTPIWFTEGGWQVGAADGGKFNKPATSTVSAQQQAAYRVRYNVWAMSLGIERVNHMYVIDTDNYNGGFFANGKPRLQATAQQVQQRIIGSASAIDTVVSNSTTRAFRLTTPTGPVVVAWSDQKASLSADLPAGTKVLDMYGTQLQVTSRQGQVIALDSSPKYLVLPAAAAPPASAAAPAPAKPTTAASRTTASTSRPQPKPAAKKTAAKKKPRRHVKKRHVRRHHARRRRHH